MRRSLPALVTLAILASVPFAYATDINVDLQKNGGPTAWDVALVFAGQETFDGFYNGWSSGVFGHTQVIRGNNTTVHWSNPSGSVAGDGIDNGETIHVGVTVSDKNATLIDAYWTDKLGRRIPGQVLITSLQIHANGVTVVNAFGTDPIDSVTLSYAVLDAPLGLTELSSQNADLMGQLQPLGGEFSLAPGEAVFVPFPASVAPGSSIVVVAESQSAASQAIALDFQQDSF